jgi:tricarballylate dehydrogenase
MMSDASYDVVVVGCGGAGLSAALSYAATVAEQGRTAHIAVLERSTKEERGGATRYTTARLRIDDDNNLDPTFADMVAATHRDADVEYCRTLQRETPETIRFIEERGVELVHYPLGLATGIHGGREAAPTGGGKAIVEALATRLEETEGAEIHYETEAVDLTTDERGAVNGVRARGRDGYLRTLRAPAVILACGGWEGSKELLARYVGPNACDMPLIAPGVANNTGDGLRMATAVGGDTAGQFDMVHGEPYDARTTHPDAVVLSYPYAILVNKHAKRFIDEGQAPLDRTFEAFAYEIWRNQANEAYLVADQSMLEVPYYELLNTTDRDPVQADTLAGLAEQLGLDPAALEATVAEFNAACGPQPYDPTTLDGKATSGITPPKTNWAQPIERPPFVGYPITCAICFTFGGVRTDSSARVVSPAGAPIPGLYAAGELTGVFYHHYPVGTSVLRGLTFGRLAGAHAATVAAAVAEAAAAPA